MIFKLSKKQWDSFLKILNRPAKNIIKLQKLLSNNIFKDKKEIEHE